MLNQQQGVLETNSKSAPIHIFVNPTSGGNKASMFTSLGKEQFELRDDGLDCAVFIHDIRLGNSGGKESFNLLRQHSSDMGCVPDNSVPFSL